MTLASNPPAPRTPRVGLVLGGGGAVGAAYHAGVLAALEQDLAWDARDAEVILGTSAGALVAAVVRLGVPPSDLAALTVGVELRATSADAVKSLAERPPFPPLGLGHLLRVPRLPGPAMMLGLAKLSAKQRGFPLGGLGMLLAEGREALAPHLAFLDAVADGPVRRTLLVCAVRRRDWHRTVFGTGAVAAPVSAAVAASCAVPGYFAGVAIHGETYIDGGAVSATNADVLGTHELDLAIVVSPMTGNAHWPPLSRLVRRQCRRTLDQEVRTLRRRGIPTVVIEPGRSVLRHMSLDFMNEDANIDIVRSAFLDTGEQIAQSPLLRSLSGRLAREAVALVR